MYYSNGNYEAFARPVKPARSESVSAYLVGSGLASLASAAFLIRDGRVPGEKSIFWKNWRSLEAHWTVFMNKNTATSSEVEERWKVILNVSGIFIDQFLL